MTVQPGTRIEGRSHLRAVVPGERATERSGKFAPPRFPADIVGLADMHGWLDRVDAHEVVLVRAPAGYGKTAWSAAVLAEAQRAGWRTAWLSVDADGVSPDDVFDAAGFPRTEDIPFEEAATILASRIDALDTPILLVIDDADCWTGAEALGLLDRLMRHPPRQLRLLLVARGEPALATAAIRARGMALSVGTADLALDDAEAAALLRDRRDAGGIADLLEGWPAGLRLAMQGGSLVEAIGDWLDPLVETLAKPVRVALRRCAVAPWIDADLCRLLAGEQDGAAMLDDLVARGFFIEPLVGDARRFRIHPAIRAALQARLDLAEPGAAAQLHRVAARYYAARGATADAVDQWVACGDFDEAATAASGISMGFVASGATARIAAWTDALTVGQGDLARARLWLAALKGKAVDPSAGDDGEMKALGLFCRAFADDRPDATIEGCDQLLGAPCHLSDFAIDMVRATLAHAAVRRGLFGLVHDAARPVLLRSGGGSLDLPTALAICAKSAAARAQGQLGEAERLLREARVRPAVPGLATGLVDAILSRAAYERDALDEAAVLANGALTHLEASAFQDAAIQAFLVAIRIAAGAGRADEAASLIDRAELRAFERGWLPLKALCVVERARLRLPQTIDAETIVPAAEEEAAIVDPLSAQARAFALLSEMRAYEAIAVGDRPRLTQVADRLLRLAANGDDAELRASATLFNILPQLSGRCDKMVELETVRFLNHAASRGFRRTIVDVLDVTGVRAVQNFCSEAYTSDCFLALLKLAEPSRRNPALEGGHGSAPGEAFSFLTEREIEILSALNAGESNKEIARTLQLAPETVKWHLKNVMRKLRAGSREEAVLNASTLGLKLVEGGARR